MNTEEKTTTRYNFKQIEEKWQTHWEETSLFKAPDKPDPDNTFYMLVMFAYPSGDIHMGHFRNYIIGDAVARYQMMHGKAVLHPFGWDAFGLPAERAAIKHGVHPQEWTEENIAVSRTTLQKVGISFDWSREIVSCRPDYYKWTQWMFIELFKRGLAYRKRGFVNWCPEDKTVLANEQVKDGRCERCETLVEKKEQVQWYFKTTEYADRLIDDLDKLPNWPENLKTIQKEWIGRSYGTEVDFIIEETGEKLPIFTTRVDTIYGVTYMAISPESEILSSLKLEGDYATKVAEYRKKAMARTDIERSAVTDDKDGVFTGKYIINPYNGEKIQLWVADYVLAGYGTGAVMAVPAHDTRDFAFARKYDIPIKVVVSCADGSSLNENEMTEAHVDYQPLVNSDQFNGLTGQDAIEKMTAFSSEKGFGRQKVNYRLKDWLISRQRYWGCPIPIIHCEKCGEVVESDNNLPVELPILDDCLPKGRSPLADCTSYMNVKCPKCGGEAQRDPDTMDTFVCSSWYYLRYIDPNNDKIPFDKEQAAAWLPVDLYIGGITHATGHLIYFRFFHKFLKDIGWVKDDEPATAMFNHGMVSDSEGVVMSKSKGNVVSPIELMDNRGVDVSRLAMFFTAPSEKEVQWSDDAITGVEKFVLNRLLPVIDSYRGNKLDLKQHFKVAEFKNPAEKALYVKLNQTIKKVSESIDRLQFNTAISALMELIREYKPAEINNDELNDQIILKVIQMVAPLAPHLAEELWEKVGHVESVFRSSWPTFDPEAVVGDQIEIAVQVNGKMRGTIMVSADASQDEVEQLAGEVDKIAAHIEGKQIVKKIFVKGRLLNIVVKG